MIFHYSKHHNGLLYYFFINTIFKFIPILLIYKNSINIQDIVFTCIFIIIYVAYMLYIKDDIICVYRDMINYYIDENTGRQTEIAYNIRKYIPYKAISTI
jgi:hypothetical protein